MSTTFLRVPEGNTSNRAYAQIVFTAAEIIRRKAFRGTQIFDQAWVGATSTLQLAVDTFEADGTAIEVHDELHTAALDVPMWTFLIDAIATFAAAMDDIRVTASQSSQDTFRIDVLPIGVDGSSHGSIKAQTLLIGTFVFTLVAPS